MIKKFFKMILYTILSLVALLLVVSLGFYFFSPQFGARGTISEQAKQSSNYLDGTFQNLEETTLKMEFKWDLLVEFFKKGNKEPKEKLSVEKLSAENLLALPDTTTRITWFGHSAVLVEMEGKKIFLDPMLGDAPTPIPFSGPHRFQKELPLDIDLLPELDAVLISHDHYDHLDHSSVLKLKHKVKMFYVPLGVGEHLKEWGVEAEKIVELDWWQSAQNDSMQFVATPSRHFSGRGLSDRNATQWCSWVIEGKNERIYFSGDSGYGKHFKEIGDKYGPFDFTMMECGQYNENWANIHMMPEETAQAHHDLRGKLMLPIHWGSFALALHSWTDPIERVQAAAQKLNIDVITPKVGEPIVLGQEQEFSAWWQNIE